VVVFPNAKINLGLNVVSKRDDGYHNISSCFYPINWSDILEIIPSKTFQFSSSGMLIEGDEKNNLCVKAYGLLVEAYKLPAVHIHLHKVIPMGAGLGGGSSDGAYTLVLLNQMFDLRLSTLKLQELASKLGSDCPFFIKNVPAVVSGVGETIQPMNFSLKNYELIVIYPKVHISTKEAYQGITPKYPIREINTILNSEISIWKKELKNDFEIPVISNHSEINNIKNSLYNLGAKYASMTGSGSAVYGIFQKDTGLKNIAKINEQYLTWFE